MDNIRQTVLENYRACLPDAVMGFFEAHRPLSNFHVEPFTWDGILWSSSEAAFQAAKTTDRADREAISKMSPADAKRAGQRVKLIDDWDGLKSSIMLDILTAKFDQCRIAHGVLIGTGRAHLEECNWWGDRYWGTVGGVGRNELGIALMAVRSRLLNPRALTDGNRTTTNAGT